MAKNFPYFKFTSSRWLTGDIVFEDLETQGLFINICALFWQRDGEITIQDIERRFSNTVEKAKLTDRLAKLTDRFIYVIDGKISIKFLDEQILEISEVSEKNSKNGQKGGRPKSLTFKEKKAKKTHLNPPLSDLNPPPSKEEKKRKEKNILTDGKKKYFESTIKDEVWKESLMMMTKINNPDEWINKFQIYSTTTEEVYNRLAEYRAHCARWIKSQLLKPENKPVLAQVGSGGNNLGPLPESWLKKAK